MWGTSGRNEFISCSDKSGKRPNIRSVSNAFRVQFDIEKEFHVRTRSEDSNIDRSTIDPGY